MPAPRRRRDVGVIFGCTEGSFGSRIDQVNLSRDADRAGQGGGPGGVRGRIGQPQDKIGASGARLGPADALALNGSLSLAKAGRVDQCHRVAAEV